MQKRKKPQFKQTAFDTAVRNPERYINILSTIRKFEGKILNKKNILDMVCSLYLSGEVKSGEIKIKDGSTTDSIKNNVIKVNSTRNSDGGFPSGYSSRFWTYMRTLSELGFVYTQYNEKFEISEIGKKLLNGEIDEQEAFSIQAMKYNRKSPYRNVSNDYNFFRLLLKILIELEKKGKKLSYEQFIILTFNQTGTTKETLDILKNNTFTSIDSAYNFVSKHYKNTNKIKTVTIDYPDVIRRLLILCGFITIRYQGKKFIEINRSKINYIKDILSLNFTLSEFEKENATAYFNKLNKDNSGFLELIYKNRSEDTVDAKEHTKKLYKIIDEYNITEDKIVFGIKNIETKIGDIHEEFSEIPKPLKLEFYISIFLAIKYKDEFEIKPNYKIDHIGKPYSHAPGNKGDIDLFSKKIYWLIEVTLIRNKTQLLNNETTSIVRHLTSDSKFKNYNEKYMSLVAPVIHEDTEKFLVYSIIDNRTNKNNIYIKPYSLNSFLETSIKKQNLTDMKKYSKNKLVDFMDKFN